MNSQVSKFSFEDLKNDIGFRVLRLGQEICTLKLEKSYLELSALNSFKAKHNVFAFYSIIEKIALYIIENIQQVKNKTKSGFWMKEVISKSIGKKVAKKIRELHTKINEDILMLNMRLFQSNIKNPPVLNQEVNPETIETVRKYRAATCILESYSKYIGAGVTYKNWWNYYNKKPTRQMVATLKRLPGNIPLNLLAGHFDELKLKKVLTYRLQILGMCFCNKRLREIILNTEEKEFKKGIRLWNRSGVGKVSCKSVKQLREFLSHLDIVQNEKNFTELIIANILKTPLKVTKNETEIDW